MMRTLHTHRGWDSVCSGIATRASSAGAYWSFILGAAASLGYLVPSLGLSVATAGNMTWVLGLLGLVVGSLLWPEPPKPETR